jgi:ferric-dicitrate binding protein FerR (iron transport regulator)
MEAVVSDDDKLDLDAWEAQLPPSDFAERVLGQLRAEVAEKAPEPRKAPENKRRWRRDAAVVSVLALAAALAIRVTSAPASHGETIAKDRIEVSLGSRALAVLEPGAQVKWDGDDVVQSRGDVFYRVEPGARFRVHTPAGDVEVKGTCFAVKVRGEGAVGQSSKDAGTDMNKRDVKSGVVGAALSALAFVAVYEGKVAVSHASERVDLGAGESAQVGSDGVKKSGAPSEGEKSFDAKAAANAAGNTDAPLAQANENLVAQVSEYRSRLEAIAAQKIELEQKLKKSEEKLAADGGPTRTRAEYDLNQEDWQELAKKGQVKFRYPCFNQSGWELAPNKVNELGLAPQDTATIKEAYKASYERIWKEIRPMCAAAIGTSLEVVDKIGPDSCPHLIYDAAAKTDKDAASEAHTQVAEIRAGLRAEPGPNEKNHPVENLYLLLTGANKAFEADLAKSFGPDEAHRLAMSDDMCMSNNRWGGGKKREPASDSKK